MKRNVGTNDQVVRILIGLAIGAIGFAYRSLWGLVGLIPIATAFVGYCMVYRFFGISTCRKKK